MNKAIRTGIAAFALGASALGALASPAAAQRWDNSRHDRDDRYDDRRHDRRDHDRGRHNGWDRDRHDRHDRTRVVVVRERYAPPPRIVYRYDYNRPDPRYHGYYADRYYRSGYSPVVVSRQTRIYRGDNGRYYCRRSDGTTGLVIGAALGGVIGDRLDRGDNSILGAILGAGAGAAIGREIDRGAVTCR